MKVILTPNLESPFNLIRIAPNQDLLSKYGSEEAMIDYVVARNKEVGVIPEGASYWIVDEADLPSDEYFFDACEWED